MHIAAETNDPLLRCHSGIEITPRHPGIHEAFVRLIEIYDDAYQILISQLCPMISLRCEEAPGYHVNRE